MDKLRVVGSSAPVTDAENKVSGKTLFAADIKLPNMLYGKFLLSPHAHAKIISIDTTKAEQLEGVKAIASCFNTPTRKFSGTMKYYDHDPIETEQIFPRVVKYVGDRVCAVAATTEKIAEAAIKLIEVEYEVYPHVLTIDEAIKEDAVQLYDDLPNKLGEIDEEIGNVDDVFSNAYRVYEDTYTTPVVNHCAMETHAAIADYDRKGKVTVYTTTQAAFSIRSLLSHLFDLPMTKIRVIKPPLGGAFGAKIPATLEPHVVALSKLAGRPVKMVLSRKETFISTNTRHASKVWIKTGVSKTGEIIAQDIVAKTNTGAYATAGFDVAGAMSEKPFVVYKTPNIRFKSMPVMSNIQSAGAMRGYGAPQFFFAQQLQLNKIANDLGIDFVDMQLMNVAEHNQFEDLGNTRLKDCVVKGKELFDWDKRRNEQVTEDVVKGYGMAIACHGNGVYKVHRDYTGVTLKANEDGTFTIHTGVHEMGTGIVRMQTMVAAEVLKIDYNDFTEYESDTDVVPWNIGDYASRGVFVSGNAAKLAAEKMSKKLLEVAATILNEDESSLRIVEGGFVEGTKKVSFSDIVVYAQGVIQKNIIAEASYANEATRISYGVHFAEVEVNKTSGEVKVIDYVAVHDVGRVMNRKAIEGQLEGGIQMGLGYALTEECLYDETGRMTNANFKKYKIFKAKDMPNIIVDFIEEGDQPGPFGGKSIGECAVNPVAPAVANAVVNALGKNFTNLPLNPKRIISR